MLNTHLYLNREDLKPPLLVSPKEDDNIICYSGFFYKSSPDKLSQWVSNQMSSSSAISNMKKKHAIQSILTYFNDFLDKNSKSSFSIQFFIQSKSSDIYYLSPAQEILVNENYTKDFYFDDLTFNIDYWDDLYFNHDYKSVFEVKKDKIQIHIFTKTKYKEKEICSIEEIQEKTSKYKPIYCLKTKENANTANGIIFTKIEQFVKIYDLQKCDRNASGLTTTSLLSLPIHKKLIEITNLFQLENNIKELIEHQTEIQRNPDLYIFGNDIIKAIKNYEVKEILCFIDMKKKIESRIPTEYLNFKWCVFPNDKKTMTDFPEILHLEQYKGIIAIRYFVY